MCAENKIATIGFDDGGVFDERVISILQSFKIPATFYLSSALLTESYYQMYKMDSIRSLYTKEMEIGAHGRTHRRVSEIPNERMEEEISRARSELEVFFQRDVCCYAYPYGVITPAARDFLMMAADLEFARGVRRNDPEDVRKPRDRYNIPITCIFKGADFDLKAQISEWVLSGIPIHIVAHPWEIGKFDWWEDLTLAIKILMTRYTILTNSQFFRETVQ